MIKTYGTTPHKLELYDLQLTGQPSKSGNSTIFNGTPTVTMRDGPEQDVPTSINLLDAIAVSIWFDPNKVNNHFGDINLWDPTPYMRRVATIFQINQWAKTRLMRQHKMGAKS